MTMYLLFGIFIVVCLFFLCLQLYRRRSIIQKVRCMDFCEKVRLLNEIMKPFGFEYQTQGEFVATRLDAWQRQFGYRALYDRTAMYFQMVFDCEPIYFYYDGRTYLVELWKGQYGITIGGEVGIYYVNEILTPDQFATALFQSVSNQELFRIKMTFYHRGIKLFDYCKRHWWLGGFRIGEYGEPEDVTMNLSITCPNQEIVLRLVESLLHIGYQACDLSVCDLTVSLWFGTPHGKQPRLSRRLSVAWAQWKNRLFCKLYRLVTKPFTDTLDRLLYLYFFLPIAFRRMLIHRKNRKCRFHKKKRGGADN